MARANTPPRPTRTDPYGACIQIGRTRPHCHDHTQNPPGSKLLRRAFKNSTGKKRPSPKLAHQWYSKLHGPSVFNPDGINIERNKKRRERLQNKNPNTEE